MNGYSRMKSVLCIATRGRIKVVVTNDGGLKHRSLSSMIVMLAAASCISALDTVGGVVGAIEKSCGRQLRGCQQRRHASAVLIKIQPATDSVALSKPHSSKH